MVFESWLAFAVASAVLLVIPGPTILAVISYSIAHGRQANIPLVAAVALGDSTSLFSSIVGLGTLLAMSAFWFTAVKVAGANSTAQLWLLAVTFVVLATINATLYTVFASSARRLLTSAKAQRRFNFTGGALLTTAGIWALLAKRPAL